MEKNSAHATLNRQLKRLHLTRENPPKTAEEWTSFLATIDSTYSQNDQDRYLVERALEVSSEEMRGRIETNKQMSLQLAQAGKMASLGTLASGVAHELNNPLMGIMGYTQLLKDKQPLDADGKGHIEKVLRLTERMSHTVNLLRKLSRQSTDKEFTRVDLRTPIRDTVDLLGRQLMTDGISFEVVMPEQSPIWIMGDSNRLESVFQNFVTNSRDAFLSQSQRPASRTISLKVTTEKSKVLVVYEDNAGGIPASIAKKVFDPFFTTKPAGVGTGLGLAITRQIISDHHAKLTMDSQEGAGTKFTLTFDAFSTEEEAPVSLGDVQVWLADVASSEKKKASLLIVDDEPFIGEFLNEVLSPHYSTQYFSAPKEALKYAESNKVDFLITDVTMPGMNGIELATKVALAQPAVLVLILSGHATEEIKSVLTVPTAFLQKPVYKSEEILKALQALEAQKQTEGKPK
jgi:signal transduction histidine kinase/ActR/RegA family two-component response regulator